MKIYIAIAITFLLFATVSAQKKRGLTEKEAVKVAEEFVAMNGYTDLPPIEDRSKVSFETVERGPTVEDVLRLRHNTLMRKAYGVSNHAAQAEEGWTVVFRTKYADDDFKNMGRAVTMKKDGTSLRVEHKPFRLTSVKKKL